MLSITITEALRAEVTTKSSSVMGIEATIYRKEKKGLRWGFMVENLDKKKAALLTNAAFRGLARTPLRL